MTEGRNQTIEDHVRVIFGERAKGSWEYQAAIRLANQLWDAAIEAAARTAAITPFERVVAAIDKLKGEKRDDRR